LKDVSVAKLKDSVAFLSGAEARHGLLMRALRDASEVQRRKP
jgi:hypothetical protein